MAGFVRHRVTSPSIIEQFRTFFRDARPADEGIGQKYETRVGPRRVPRVARPTERRIALLPDCERPPERTTVGTFEEGAMTRWIRFFSRARAGAVMRSANGSTLTLWAA